MADATTAFAGDLPAPDYTESPDDDPTLRVPAIIKFDDWRGAGSEPVDAPAFENFPQPPAHLLREDDDESFPEPPPDYEGFAVDDTNYPGLIPPYKLPNPVLDSRGRMQINKDIKFNAKHGISVLNTKPELEKELERRKVEKEKRALAEMHKKNRNSFEQKLDLQKEKLNSQEKIVEEEANLSELSRIHNKIKSKGKEPQ